MVGRLFFSIPHTGSRLQHGKDFLRNFQKTEYALLLFTKMLYRQGNEIGVWGKAGTYEKETKVCFGREEVGISV